MRTAACRRARVRSKPGAMLARTPSIVTSALKISSRSGGTVSRSCRMSAKKSLTRVASTRRVPPWRATSCSAARRSRSRGGLSPADQRASVSARACGSPILIAWTKRKSSSRRLGLTWPIKPRSSRARRFPGKHRRLPGWGSAWNRPVRRTMSSTTWAPSDAIAWGSMSASTRASAERGATPSI